MKILITGGHLTPALAVIEELLKQDEKINIVYVGRQYSQEAQRIVSNDYKVVSEIKGVKYLNLEAGRLHRNFSWATIRSLLKVPKGFLQAYHLLKDEKPNVILSFGGYLALPVVVMGFIRRIPVFTHEQTVVVGLSNRIIGFMSQKIFLAWAQSQKYFNKSKTIVVGNPVRKEILETSKVSMKRLSPELQEIIRMKLSDQSKILIYVTGGNQGSQTINRNVWNILPDLTAKYLVIHQCGDLDWQKINGEELPFKLEHADRYYLSPWFNNYEVSIILNVADLVISRAGANTTYELGLLGKPSLFIPIPWVVNNEQQKNAEVLSNEGLARIVSQNNLKPQKLLNTINEMVESLPEYQEKGRLFSSGMKKEAAPEIVKNLITLESVSH